MIHVVGRAQDFGLVDVVDLERLQNLSFHEVANACLRHHRDGHRVDNALDEVGVTHASDTALRTNISRHALESHDRYSTSVLSDASLLRRDDVHNDAALQHLGKPTLDTGGT